MATFDPDADFVPFADEEPRVAGAFANAPVAQGQRQLYTSGVGAKRHADSMLNSYDNKLHNTPDSRHAPWASLVDWDSCENAAEM